MTYQFWQIILSYTPQSQSTTKMCSETVWYSMFVYVVCTLLAQVVLTLRIHAMTMKNLPITSCLAFITASQFALGMWTVILNGMGAQPLPPIPIDAYHLCIVPRHRTMETAYTSISLLYDFFAFSLTIFLATRTMEPGVKIPMILKTIVEGATLYFLVIFTSHLLLEMTLLFGREAIQLIPAPGNVVYFPVMVSRMMLSLRKAADPELNDWSLGQPPTTSSNLQSISFFRPRRGTTRGGDDVLLDTHTE